MAFKRQVSELSAETYALKNDMAFFEVSPLCDFNVTESLAELSRLVLKRNGMSRTWGPNRGKIIHLIIDLIHKIVPGDFFCHEFAYWPDGFHDQFLFLCSIKPTGDVLQTDCRPYDDLRYRSTTVTHVHQSHSQIILYG